MISNTVFLSLKDVADNLPPYTEHPTPVTMCPDLAVPYKAIEEKLRDAVKNLLRKGSNQLLSPMLHCLLCWPDLPYNWNLIGYTDRKDGPHGRFVPVVQPPTLDENLIWPKEKKLLEILRQERACGKQCWVFATYTGVHPVTERLRRVIANAGFKVRVLNADQVPTRSRSAWIAENAPGVDVMISHPEVVSTGLTLFDPRGAYNFPVLIFGQTGFNTFTLRQASRRSWRIGQVSPCDVHLLYYSQTLQERAMALMAQKLQASFALEGQFSAEGLADMSADSGSLAMELAKSLVDNIEFGETERVWARVNGAKHGDSCEQVIKTSGAVVPPSQAYQLALGLQA